MQNIARYRVGYWYKQERSCVKTTRRLQIFVVALIAICVLGGPTVAHAATDYSCGNYGAGDYQSDNCETSIIDIPGQIIQPVTQFIGGMLPNTGMSSGIVIGSGVLLLAGGGTLIILVFKKRKNDK